MRGLGSFGERIAARDPDRQKLPGPDPGPPRASSASPS